MVKFEFDDFCIPESYYGAISDQFYQCKNRISTSSSVLRSDDVGHQGRMGSLWGRSELTSIDR